MKTFDCIAFKREAALRIHEETKDLTPSERLAKWKQIEADFLAEHERAKASRMP